MSAAFMVRLVAPAFLLVLAGGCDEPDPVKIGFVGGFEGRSADLAQEGRDGTLLAVEEFNGEGGAGGHRVELLVRDDRNNPEVARKVDEELVAEGVVAIIGHMTSQMSLVGVEIANRHRVLMMSPTASTNDLTGIDDYFLRVYAASDGDAEALAFLAFEHLKVKRVSVTLDVGNLAHTKSWLDAFSKTLTGRGGEIVTVREFVSSGSASLVTIADELLVPDPDAVFVLAGSLDTGLLCQYLRGRGFDGPILVTQWSVTPDILAHGGKSADGIYFIDTFNRDSRASAFVTFKTNFSKRFNYEPGFAATYSYEAATILLKALTKTRDRERIKNEILETGEYSGLQHKIFFDRFGDINRPRYFKTISGGQFVSAE